MDIPNDRLQQLYVNKKLSIYKIAKIFNTNSTTICDRIHEYDIPIRSISEALKRSEMMKGEGNPMKRPEARKKISKAMMGKLVGDENPAKKFKVRRKISKALRGHKVSPVIKRKIARSLISKKKKNLL